MHDALCDECSISLMGTPARSATDFLQIGFAEGSNRFQCGGYHEWPSGSKAEKLPTHECTFGAFSGTQQRNVTSRSAGMA